MLPTRLRARLVVAIAFVAMAGVPVLAAEPPTEGQAVPPATPLVSVDWHGELRTRLDYLDGVRYTTADPSIAPHLDVRHGESNTTPSDGRLGLGDLRLRLEPVVRVAEWADIRTQIDAVSHLALGSQNLLARDTSDPLTATQVWTSDTGGVAGSVSTGVRRAWVHVRVLGLGDLDIGRMGDHFGLGLVRNDGRDLMADFQTDVDRIQASAELFGFRLKAARDIIFKGPLSSTAVTGTSVLTKGANATVTDGQPQPIEIGADATRWLLQAESAKPATDLGLKFAAALMYQSQDTGFYGEHGDCAAQKTCDQLIPRTVRQFTPQLYLDWRGKVADAPMRLQFEGVFRYGSVANADERSSTVTSKTLVGGGFAGKGEWTFNRHAWLVDLGLASGDRGGGFGVNDQDNWRTGAAPDAAPRSLITGYNFHRGYLVDNILFRDVIGAIANAWFVKPAWQYTLMERGENQGLLLNLAVLAALAASDNATPGKATFLGLEPEASLWWKVGKTTALLRGTMLLPGDALNAPSGASAQNIWRLDAAVRLQF